MVIRLSCVTDLIVIKQVYYFYADWVKFNKVINTTVLIDIACLPHLLSSTTTMVLSSLTFK